MAFLLFSHLAAHLVLMVAEPGTDLMHLPLVALVLGMHGAAMLRFPMVITMVVPTVIPVIVPVVVPMVIPMIIPMIVPVGVPVVIPMIVPLVISVIVPVVIPVIIPVIVPVIILMIVPTIVSVIVSLIVPTVFPLLVLLVTALLILCRFHRRHRQRCIRNRDPRDIQCHPTAESPCQDLFASHDDTPLSSLTISYSEKIGKH